MHRTIRSFKRYMKRKARVAGPSLDSQEFIDTDEMKSIATDLRSMEWPSPSFSHFNGETEDFGYLLECDDELLGKFIKAA